MGLASVAAALLSGLQTFLGDAERSEKHRSAAAQYGAVGRELECYLSKDGEISEEQLTSLRNSLNKLAIESPNIPLKTYRKAGATELEILPNKSSKKDVLKRASC